ncbi:TPA: 50S ribosomal protein L15 [Candidatus Falkowbacteria bacterium]|jgi:large subunit ribosomal protein L15|nr:MAG: 50S ribosomal protein L15 [Candidatus Falkowbacteria bacterium GW2011_GWF2_43_32]HBA36987.1 50S ribosomal protein L15 [Candidatus Falkowbacteria bacterium]
MLSLNTIKKAKGSSRKGKRVGRGNASGHGTYSTRGLKGQKSRSGVSGLKRLGMRAGLLQIPKSRGFRSLQPKNQVVSVKAINRHFKDGETVNPTTLAEKKLIGSVSLPVKILGKEKLTVKVKFEKIKMSAGVQDQTAGQK